MDQEYKIDVECLFCKAPLQVEEGVESSSGDLIKCSSCGEMNDYDSALEVAKEKGLKVVKADFEKEVEKMMKGLFKS